MLDALMAIEWVKTLFIFLISAAVTALVVVIVLRISRKFFARQIARGGGIHLRFVENIIRAVIIGLGVFGVLMSTDATASIGKTIFQGTAVLTAVVGLAGQTAISDVICGLIISIGKPFEIGDRLVLEDGTICWVKDITLRHVVLRRIDAADELIPNSRMNNMILINENNQTELRGFIFTFDIAYGSDVRKAQEVIWQAIRDSEYTRPGTDTDHGKDYGPVNFLEFGPSSLKLTTVVNFESMDVRELMRNDVNTRVYEALRANDIEIPFQYINVVNKTES